VNDLATTARHPSLVDTEARDRLARLLKGIRVAMLVTTGPDGRLRSRPMSTQEVDFDGTLRFFTDAGSSQAEDIRRDPRVHLTYASTGSENYIAVNGRARVMDDRAQIREMWTPILKAWFEGPEDPDLRLIEIDVVDAEYWDSPGGKIGSLLSIAKAIVTGEPDDGGRGTVRL
jgi:general stress protein 26